MQSAHDHIGLQVPRLISYLAGDKHLLEGLQRWWHSCRNSTSTAAKTISTDESPQEMVERCLATLQVVQESEDSWRGVVKGGDPDNFCSKREIFEVWQRALSLSLAYQLALQK